MRQVRWSDVPFSHFPQFIVIHTVRGFGLVNKAEVDVFLVFSCFFCHPTDISSLISGSSALLNAAWTSGSSRFTYCWSLAWKILSITLLVCEMSVIAWWFEHSLALPFFGIGMKPYLFHSCSCFWVFQFFWHIECSTLTVSFFFNIWNSSTEFSTNFAHSNFS